MKIEDIKLRMTVYYFPGTKAEVARGASPVKLEVRGFGLSVSTGGNQIQKVICHITEGEGSGAIKNGLFFGYLALDAAMLRETLPGVDNES